MGASIFNGTAVKILKNILRFKDGTDLSSDKVVELKANTDLNYILNNKAEVDTTGWTASGGFFAIARSTSTPLRGDADFSLTKSANNAQNAYIGYDFTIDSADLASILTISMDIETITAGIADGDFSVRIYDNTAAAYIPLATEDILAGKGQFISSFQTDSANTSYSLRFFVNTTSAAAMLLNATNIMVGKKAIVLGVPSTDWEDFTPTGAWSTNTTYTGKYRRVGDTAEFDITVALSGAPNSATLNVNLPSGLSIDTNKITGTSVSDQKLGDLYLLDNGTANIAGSVCYSTATVVTCRYMFDFTGNTGVASVTQTAPFTFANGDKVNLRFSAPIAGWSSNVQMSETTLNRDISDSTYDTSISVDTTEVKYTPSVFVKQTIGNQWTGDSWYAPESGRYKMVVTGYTQASTTERISSLKWRKNTATIDSSLYKCIKPATTPSVEGYINFTSFVDLVKGDYLQLGMEAASARTWGRINVLIEKINTGSQTIAVSEEVYVAYAGNAGTVVTANVTLIDFNDIIFDSHGAFSGTTFTAPKSGKYIVNGSICCTAALERSVTILIDGTPLHYIYPSLDFPYATFSDILSLDQGQTLSLRLGTNGGTLLDSNSVHFITIRSL